MADDHPPGSVECVLVHDGTVPPATLFDALVAAGWRCPVPPPPPRDAIDWSRADPRTGKPYTIAPYPARTRLVPPEDCSEAEWIAVAARLVRSHGGSTAAELAPRGSSMPAGGGTGSEPAPVQTVTLTVETPKMPELIHRLGPLAVVVTREPVTITRHSTYRGRTCETTVAAERLELRVPADALDEVSAVAAHTAAAAVQVSDDSPG